MISTEVQDNKVLVIAQGNINLVVEPQIGRKRFVLTLRKHAAVFAVASLSGALVSMLITLFVAGQIRSGIEDRLAARIAEVDAHLNAIAATAGMQSDLQSNRMLSRVDEIGIRVERVGRDVQVIGNNVDDLPTTIQRSSEDSAKSLISWLSALRAPVAVKAAPLTVHGPEKKRSAP
jgi:hypothetical protein